MRTFRVSVARVSARSLAAAAVLAAFGSGLPARSAADELALRLRSRTELAPASARFQVVERPETWKAKETAVIVCDMWDLHHCLNAVRRVKEMAPTMDRVLAHARARGALIIHAPSGCMSAYEDNPARRRAIETPRAAHLPVDIQNWCYKIPAEEKGVYPIDQTNGGEDDDPAEHAEWAAKLTAMGRNPKSPWKSQTEMLKIDPAVDIISDRGDEIWSVIETRGIKNVILLGVHANMCVLGRPFGLRQMAKNGKNVVLMRDMTDTMYDPHSAPYVSHFTGTDLIVEHVEKYVCPTITSDQLLGGAPLRFKGDTRPHVVMVIADDEYKTETTLPVFAAAELRKDYHVSYVLGHDNPRDDLPGLNVLDTADVMLVSARRRVPTAPQTAALRKFVASGKAVVGIRTASHAFAPSPAAKGSIAEGHAAWSTFDPEVLGGNYHGHHREGPTVAVALAPSAADHPILNGVDVAKLTGHGSLYKVSPLASTATPLLLGSIPDAPVEPIAWTSAPASGGRVFYTSMGHVDDFAEPDFNRLLKNAIEWAAGRR